jgi:two-component system, chemotaxis family, sensor kinase CheA
MDTNDYLQLFIEETQEHLQAISDNLMALEKSPTDLEIVNTIFRSAHTLKGMAGAMHYENMAHLTHEMESSLDELRAGRLQVTENVLNVLFDSQDVLQRQLDQVMNAGSDEGVEIDSTIAKIRAIERGAGESASAHRNQDVGSILDTRLRRRSRRR